jgi:hypothetical protein
VDVRRSVSARDELQQERRLIAGAAGDLEEDLGGRGIAESRAHPVDCLVPADAAKVRVIFVGQNGEREASELLEL